MSKMIQIRHVPDEVHSTLKERAASEGMSLTDFLLREIDKVAARPAKRDVINRILSTPHSSLQNTPDQVVREIRETR